MPGIAPATQLHEGQFVLKLQTPVLGPPYTATLLPLPPGPPWLRSMLHAALLVIAVLLLELTSMLRWGPP